LVYVGSFVITFLLPHFKAARNCLTKELPLPLPLSALRLPCGPAVPVKWSTLLSSSLVVVSLWSGPGGLHRLQRGAGEQQDGANPHHGARGDIAALHGPPRPHLGARPLHHATAQHRAAQGQQKAQDLIGPKREKQPPRFACLVEISSGKGACEGLRDALRSNGTVRRPGSLEPASDRIERAPLVCHPCFLSRRFTKKGWL
ncbi:unnamed protein product, partial [Phaeothamnion confervicola]